MSSKNELFLSKYADFKKGTKRLESWSGESSGITYGSAPLKKEGLVRVTEDWSLWNRRQDPKRRVPLAHFFFYQKIMLTKAAFVR